MVNLKNPVFLIKTGYSGRNEDKPLLSVTKSAVALNSAISKEYLKGNKLLYCQIIEQGGVKYLLLSAKPQDGFYPLRKVSKQFIITARAVTELLGKKGVNVKYALASETTNVKDIQAYKLATRTEYPRRKGVKS